MAAIKQTNKKLTLKGAYFMLHYIIKVFGEPDDMIASLSFANLVSSFLCWLKDCNNGQERENEETVIYESRNDLVQSCWDLAANQV